MPCEQREAAACGAWHRPVGGPCGVGRQTPALISWKHWPQAQPGAMGPPARERLTQSRQQVEGLADRPPSKHRDGKALPSQGPSRILWAFLSALLVVAATPSTLSRPRHHSSSYPYFILLTSRQARTRTSIPRVRNLRHRGEHSAQTTS